MILRVVQTEYFKAMSKFYDIDEGYTLDLLIPAFFVALIGALGALFHIAITVVLVLVAILLVVMRSGVEVDVSGKRIRVYKSFGKWRYGTWIDLEQFDHVRIKYTKESQVMNARSITNTHRVKTFDLIFRTPGGAETEFHDFTDYALARRAMIHLVNELAFDFDDGVQDRRRSAKDHDPDRRY